MNKTSMEMLAEAVKCFREWPYDPSLEYNCSEQTYEYIKQNFPYMLNNEFEPLGKDFSCGATDAINIGSVIDEYFRGI